MDSGWVIDKSGIIAPILVLPASLAFGYVMASQIEKIETDELGSYVADSAPCF